MFEYKYEVKSPDGYSWGLFKTIHTARIMCDALSNKFSHITFTIEVIK
jgi:hypothetical protein